MQILVKLLINMFDSQVFCNFMYLDPIYIMKNTFKPKTEESRKDFAGKRGYQKIPINCF